MDAIQIWTAVGGTSIVTIVLTKMFDHLKTVGKTKREQRRSEIDRIVAAEREARILKESLAIHRRVIIDAECLGPGDLPPWPTSTHKTKESHD